MSKSGKSDVTEKVLEVLRSNGANEASQEFGKLNEVVHSLNIIATKEGAIGKKDEMIINKYERLLDKMLEDNIQKLQGAPAQQIIEAFEEIANKATPERAAFIKAATDGVVKKYGIERGSLIDEKDKKEFALMVNTLESLAVGGKGDALIGPVNAKEYQQQVKSIKDELEQGNDFGKAERLKQKLSSLKEWCEEKSHEATANTSRWTSFTKAVKAAVSMVSAYCRRDTVGYEKSKSELEQIRGDSKSFAHNLDRIKNVLGSPKSATSKDVSIPKTPDNLSPAAKNAPQIKWER